MRKTLLAALLLCLFAVPSWAQQGKLYRINTWLGPMIMELDPEAAADPQGSSFVFRFKDEGTTIATRGGGLIQIDCVGAGVACTWSGTTLTVTVSAGATTFVALTDTPANYSGAGSKLVRVNAGATALEFVDGSTLYAPIASPTFTGTVTIPTPFTLGAVSVTPTGTELNFVDGVTSAIQTQLDAKAPLANPTFTGTVTIPGAVPATAGVGNFGSATLPFGELFIAGTSGTPGTNNFKITGVSTSGTRVVTLADGSSVTVIGDAGAANNFLSAINPTTGAVTKARPTPANLDPTGCIQGDSITIASSAFACAGNRITTDARTTATETITCADVYANPGKLYDFSNAGAIAVSIDETIQAGVDNCNVGTYFYIRQSGAGVATVTPTTVQVNGAATLATAAQYDVYKWVALTGGWAAFKMPYSSAGGASTADAFLTVGHPADLTAERNLAVSGTLKSTDGGVNSDLTLADYMNQAEGRAVYVGVWHGGGSGINLLNGFGADEQNSWTGTFSNINATDGQPAAMNCATGLLSGDNCLVASRISPWRHDRTAGQRTNLYVKWRVNLQEITTVRYWGGFRDTSPDGSDDPAVNLAMFRFSTNATDTNWQCVSNDAAAGGTITDSTIAVSAGQFYVLEIIFDDTVPNIVFKIDGTTRCTHTTNLPTDGTNMLLSPIEAETLTTAARNFRLQRVLAWMDTP